MRNQQGGEFAVFHGSPFQRGYGQVGFGLGSFFKSIARSASPLIQKGLKSVGRTALNTGMKIAQDVATGGNLGESAKKRLTQAASQLKRDAMSRVQTGTGKRRRGSSKSIKLGVSTPRRTSRKSGKGKAPKARGLLTAQDIFNLRNGR